MKRILFRSGIFLLALTLLLGASESFAAKKKPVKVVPKKKIEKPKLFPEFLPDSQWLQTPKLTREFFTDKVTLVYFWDYNSINCIRELKALKTWAAYYKPYRFQILWVHASEFEVGTNPKNIKEAVERFGVQGPVLMDNKFKLWEALEIKAWPTKLLVDEKGKIIFRKGGEGEYFNMEAQIRNAVKNLDKSIVLPEPIYKEDIEAYSPQECGEMTGETYLGYKKSTWWGAQVGNKQWVPENKEYMFRDKGERSERGFFAEGLWTNREEYLEHARDTEDLSDYAGLLYQGREVYVVADAWQSDKEKRVYVTRDDQPVPPHYRGPDLRVDESGETYFAVNRPHLYYLLQEEDSEPHELKLWTSSKDVKLYSFSFSNLCLSDFEHR